MSVTFAASTPALPSANVERSLAFYRDVLGFEPVHVEEGFAVLRRDDARLNLWSATDESWRERTDWTRPIVSGAESFIAGTASCRIEIEGVNELYAACAEHVHPNGKIEDTWWGTREFAVLDPDGNLIGLYEERAS